MLSSKPNSISFKRRAHEKRDAKAWPSNAEKLSNVKNVGNVYVLPTYPIACFLLVSHFQGYELLSVPATSTVLDPNSSGRAAYNTMWWKSECTFSLRWYDISFPGQISSLSFTNTDKIHDIIYRALPFNICQSTFCMTKIIFSRVYKHTTISWI